MSATKKEKRKQYWFVIKELTSRELKRKYARSYLGILWSVLNPLLSMAIISAIFSTMFKNSIEKYPIYYLTGMLIWQLFTNATNVSVTALVDNKSLLIKVMIPMQVFILSKVYTTLINFGYSFVAYVVFLLVFRIPPGITMLAIVPIVALTLLFSIGVGMFLSTAYVFFGDIQYIYGVILTLWMYMSALFYPISSLSGIMALIVRENPMYIFIASARDCMMYGEFPEVGQWFRMILWAVVAYVAGQVFFNKKKNDIMRKV